MRSGSFNISKHVNKHEQVSTILVSISVNEAIMLTLTRMLTSMFQLLVVLVLLGRILDADWSENDILIGRSYVYYYWKALKSIVWSLSHGALLHPVGPTQSLGS